uniref:Uncharacterized protein n=1 Tax=Oryza rufipogon TaxID=4529 RepID=A0A0E0RA94_ORYRU
MGLDNAGKTTTLYKLHLGEAVTTAPPSAAMSRRSSSRTSDSRASRTVAAFGEYKIYYHPGHGGLPPPPHAAGRCELFWLVLNDPDVSMVFGEVGFRREDIKLAILRPVHAAPQPPPHAQLPPFLFLCSFAAADNTGIPYPAENLTATRKENCRRIANILSRTHNPCLLSVVTGDAREIEGRKKRRGSQMGLTFFNAFLLLSLTCRTLFCFQLL